jgi:hypothetical protein
VASAIGPSKYLGKSYEQHKADIGGKDFHMAMLSAVGAYVNRNWPTPDLEWLRNDLRERVMTCDAPGRKLHDREHRAGKHLDDLLDWVAETHGKRIEDQDRELARLLEQGIKEAETKHPEGGELLRNFFDDFALARGRR